MGCGSQLINLLLLPVFSAGQWGAICLCISICICWVGDPYFLSLLQDNWGALKGKMFGRSLSVEPGRGKEVLSEFKESKGGIKGLKRGEVKGSQKGQQATCSQQQSPPERDATSPRKTRRSQRGQTGKGKGEKQGVISTPRNMTVTRFPCCSSFNLQWRGVVSACSSRQL